MQELHGQLKDQGLYVSTNQKEYKFSSANIINWFECLTIVTNHLLSKDPENFDSLGLQLIIFDFFTFFPYNNLLHLSVQGFLNAILDSKNKELNKTFLLQNLKFEILIKKIIKGDQDNSVKEPQGYSEFIKGFFEKLQNLFPKAVQQSNILMEYNEKIYLKEIENMKKIFQEIDDQRFTETADQNVYHFTLDEVKHCFESFLNQQTNDSEHLEVQRVSELNLADQSEQKKTVYTEEIDIK
jgi:hypothetical protein